MHVASDAILLTACRAESWMRDPPSCNLFGNVALHQLALELVEGGCDVLGRQGCCPHDIHANVAYEGGEQAALTWLLCVSRDLLVCDIHCIGQS